MNDTTAEAQANSLAKVLTALATLGEAAASTIAEHAGLGYSTTTPKLRALEEVELAERLRADGGRTLWRLTTAGRAAAEAAAHADPDSSAAATSSAATEPGTDGTEPAARHGDELPVSYSGSDDLDADKTSHDGDDSTVAESSTDAVLGAVAPGEDVEGSPDDPEPDTPLAADSEVTGDGMADVPAGESGDQPVDTSDSSAARLGSAPHGVHDGQPNQDAQQTDVGVHNDTEPDSGHTPSAQHDSARREAGSAEVPASGPTDQSASEQSGASTSRRSGGSLRGAIFDVLEAHPDQQYKISELCKLIDKANEGTDAAKASAGAVANAVVKLVGEHRVIQTVERPATFQLAPPTD